MKWQPTRSEIGVRQIPPRMKVIYSLRAIRDLEQIGSYHRSVADPNIADAIAQRIETVVNRLPHHPESAPRVSFQSGVRAVLVLRYPFKIFSAFGAAISKSLTFDIQRRPIRR